MRISDWSSDVCSSDLIFGLVTHESEIVIKPPFLGDPSTKSRGVSFGITKEERPHCPRSLNRRELPLQFSDFLIHIPAFKRSEEHTSELQSLMRISYAVFC